MGTRRTPSTHAQQENLTPSFFFLNFIMSAPLHAKIVVVGPQRAGKTSVVNFLANFREMPSEYYHGTVGVRIHEFEHVVRAGGKNPQPAFGGEASATVEMWDVS